MNIRVRTMIIAASISISPTMVIQASADDLSAIAGKWASEGTSCNFKAEESDNFLIVSQDGKNERHETFCKASSIRSVGSRIEFQNACTSEGERSKGKTIVLVVSPDRITWKEGKAPAMTFVRCKAGGSAQGGGQGSSSASLAFETGSFHLSSHGVSGTIVSMSGANTTAATMTGRVTRADAIEECERNSPGGEGLKPKSLQKCVDGTIKTEAGKTYTATADCKARSIIASFGGRFTIAGVDREGGLRILDSKRQDIGGSTASGASSIESQFQHLCPVTFERLKRKSV